MKRRIFYCCTIGILSKTDEKKLGLIKSWYQIPNDLNLRLAVHGKWCCSPRFGVGIYEAYLLGGLTLPLNSFAREILHRLDISINQLNPNAWRLIVSMQVMWREVLRETVLLLWMSFFTIICSLRLVSFRAFISFQRGVPTSEMGHLRPKGMLISHPLLYFSLSYSSKYFLFIYLLFFLQL